MKIWSIYKSTKQQPSDFMNIFMWKKYKTESQHNFKLPFSNLQLVIIMNSSSNWLIIKIMKKNSKKIYFQRGLFYWPKHLFFQLSNNPFFICSNILYNLTFQYFSLITYPECFLSSSFPSTLVWVFSCFTNLFPFIFFYFLYTFS